MLAMALAIVCDECATTFWQWTHPPGSLDAGAAGGGGSGSFANPPAETSNVTAARPRNGALSWRVNRRP